jgi:hypothetical protein
MERDKKLRYIERELVKYISRSAFGVSSYTIGYKPYSDTIYIYLNTWLTPTGNMIAQAEKTLIRYFNQYVWIFPVDSMSTRCFEEHLSTYITATYCPPKRKKVSKVINALKWLKSNINHIQWKSIRKRQKQ